ncbi:hypothetical protein [Paraburkholderia unamae]|uniref:Uncharacterized protein n=1 Tax=Paraburkholderia unamae TaxID=219649 RepID=A0ABX5KSU7_9BURK|nr:hypothetical protein [Paraburkholderia unamae]PVX85683.1 hypothetical protein C7402_103260 [Paraburkholderia unamae]
MHITLDTAKAIYREAVDSRASDGEGATWWDEVAAEVRDVIAARTVIEAANVIAWWHHDWAVVSDTPRAAAKRMRDAARMLRSKA